MHQRTKGVLRPTALTLYVVASFVFSALLVVTWAKNDAFLFFLEKPRYCVQTEDGESEELSKTPVHYLGVTQAVYLFHSGEDLYVIPRARVEIIRLEYGSRPCDVTNP